MRCLKFHDPAFADKKEMAFKKIRGGVNHLEVRRDSEYADDVYEESLTHEGKLTMMSSSALLVRS